MRSAVAQLDNLAAKALHDALMDGFVHDEASSSNLCRAPAAEQHSTKWRQTFNSLLNQAYEGKNAAPAENRTSRRLVLGSKRIGPRRAGKSLCIEGQPGRCCGAFRHPKKRDVREPGFTETTADVAVRTCKPDLLYVLVVSKTLTLC